MHGNIEGGCELCHKLHKDDTNPTETKSFDHAASTRFALTGAHANVECAGDLATESELGRLRLRLHSPSSFDMRDANTRDGVPAGFLTDPVQGGTVIVETPAERIAVGGVPEMPPLIAAGKRASPP